MNYIRLHTDFRGDNQMVFNVHVYDV